MCLDRLLFFPPVAEKHLAQSGARVCRPAGTRCRPGDRADRELTGSVASTGGARGRPDPHPSPGHERGRGAAADAARRVGAGRPAAGRRVDRVERPRRPLRRGRSTPAPARATRAVSAAKTRATKASSTPPPNSSVAAEGSSSATARPDRSGGVEALRRGAGRHAADDHPHLVVRAHVVRRQFNTIVSVPSLGGPTATCWSSAAEHCGGLKTRRSA